MVCGLFLYLLFSGAGPLGGMKLLFTVEIMVLAQVLLISQEGRLVGEDIAVGLLRHHQAGPHAGVGGGVPVRVIREALRLGGNAQLLRPQGELR